MAIAKVVYHEDSSDTTGTVWMDVTPDTVEANKLLNPETATKKDGTKITGSIATRNAADVSKSLTYNSNDIVNISIGIAANKVGYYLNSNGNYLIYLDSNGISGLPTQAAATITPSTIQQTAVAAHKWTTGDVVVAALIDGDIAEYGHTTNNLIGSGTIDNMIITA